MLMTIFRAPICTFPCLSISKHSRLIKLLVSLGKHSRRIRGTPFPLMARSPNLARGISGCIRNAVDNDLDVCVPFYFH